MTITETDLKEREALPTDDALEARDVRIVFGDVAVLSNAIASVRPGEIVGIVGPNGSGKTTLLRAMAGLIRPASGDVLLGNRPLSDISPRQRASIIGYLPQSTANHSFTASEFVLMGRYPHIGRFSLEGRRDRELAAEAMERTGTIEFAGRRLEEMSGGERQRVALARLLAQQARYLLLDEPTSSLDMQHQQLTMETAREEADSGAGVAVVLHDLSLAARHCDRLILIHSGSVVAEGEPWDVITRDNLRRFFSVNAAIEPEPISGRPGVSLLDVADSDAADSPLRVHLVCGAGSGRDLMHRFASEGHSVTACVLGEGDADRETANRLGIQHVAAPPFSSITLEQDAEHRRLVRQADVVVVCDMAVGPGNLRNLEAATEANSLVLIDHPTDAKWDYTHGAATEVRSQLSTRAKTVPREQVLKVVGTKSQIKP